MANYATQERRQDRGGHHPAGRRLLLRSRQLLQERVCQAGHGEDSIVAEEQFQTNQTDFKAILTNIKAANPDVIFAPSSIATAPLIIKQARELGITAKIMAGDTWENGSIIENAGADAEGVMLSTFFDEGDTSNDDCHRLSSRASRSIS